MNEKKKHESKINKILEAIDSFLECEGLTGKELYLYWTTFWKLAGENATHAHFSGMTEYLLMRWLVLHYNLEFCKRKKKKENEIEKTTILQLKDKDELFAAFNCSHSANNMMKKSNGVELKGFNPDIILYKAMQGCSEYRTVDELKKFVKEEALVKHIYEIKAYITGGVDAINHCVNTFSAIKECLQRFKDAKYTMLFYQEKPTKKNQKIVQTLKEAKENNPEWFDYQFLMEDNKCISSMFKLHE